MKKLMIAAAIVCAAAYANAASIAWGFGNAETKAPDGEYFGEGSYADATAFLFLGTVTASDTAFDTSSATLLASGGFDEDWWAYGNVDADNLSSSEALTSTAAGQAYTLILLDMAGATSLDDFVGDYALVAGESAQIAVPGAVTSYYADFSSIDPVRTSSTMANAPEPTAGLLLLLGMAGLALKRKNA